MAVIRVTGDPGSGTTTLCKKLALELNYDFHYTGQIFREFAEIAGLSLTEFYIKLESDPELEKNIDKRQIQLMLNFDRLVVDGRMAPFLPCRFKTINILLKVSEGIGARRLSNRPEYQKKSIQEIIESVRTRVQTEKERYQKLYGETYMRGIEDHLAYNKDIFHISMHTNFYTAEQVFQEVLRQILPKTKSLLASS
ncbi:MAG: AAA family ATPase [Parcubacteria group bacterium]|nr:AAA family ATPase [Parcubacteria group bacterium]